MRRDSLLRKYGHLVGQPVKDLDPSKPDRIVSEILHEEPNGLVCVATRDLIALRFNNVGDWLREDRVEGALDPKGPCEKATRGRKS